MNLEQNKIAEKRRNQILLWLQKNKNLWTTHRWIAYRVGCDPRRSILDLQFLSKEGLLELDKLKDLLLDKNGRDFTKAVVIARLTIKGKIQAKKIKPWMCGMFQSDLK